MTKKPTKELAVYEGKVEIVPALRKVIEDYVESLRKGVVDPELIRVFLACQDVKLISKVPYKYGAELFASWWKECQIERLDDIAALKFKEDLRSEMKFSINTANIYLVSARKFFAFLERKGVWQNIFKDVKGHKSEGGHLTPKPEADDIRKILGLIDRTTLKGKRDFAMILTMAREGLRTISIRWIDIGDMERIGEEAKLNYLSKGRDQKDKWVTLDREVVQAIDEYLKARPDAKPEDPLFISHNNGSPGQRLSTRSIRKVVKENFRNIGKDAPRLSAHSLRHYCITDLIENEAPIHRVQALAGHASINTTMRYFHESDRFKHSAVRSGSPLTPDIGT